MQHRLHVGEAHVLADHQPFELVEHRRVRHVRVAAVDAARGDDGERRAVLLQRADLHRRGVRAQQPPVGEVEGVVHRPRRMIGGDVERLEVVEVVLDLRTRGDLEAGAPEQRLDAQARPGDRVQAARLLAAPGQRHVDAPGGELALDVGARCELRAPRLDAPPAPRCLRLVDARARRGPLGSATALPERLQLLGERALLAQPAHAHVFERREVAAGGDLGAAPGRSGRDQVRQDPPRGFRLIPRAVFACCAIAPNAAASCTAMSASTLRSISTPALFRPLMMRL